MRPPHPVWALALCAAVACRDRDRAHGPAPAKAPVRLAPEAPSAAPPLPCAAPHLAHPNASRDLRDLGARVAPQPLPLPRVALGESRRFTFQGHRRAWVLKLADEALATPAYARGKVFVGAGFHSTKVYALDARTGALAWMADTPDGGPTAAVVDDDRVLFNTESCTLFAFDARTGRPRWSHYLGDPLMSQPASAAGRVFSAYPSASSSTGFAFSAMSLRDGHFLWTREVPADVLSAPVVVGDAVYATTMEGTVTRFRAVDGRVVWRRAMGATSAPAVDGDRLYLSRRAPRGHERQVVLSARDGAVLSSGVAVRAPYARERPDTGGTEAGWASEGTRPAYADGRLYHAMGDEVVARDAETGREVWRRRYPGSVARRGVTAPAVVGSQVVVGTRDGDLLAMDIDTGATTWAWHIGEPITFQPAVANGWVYVATARGKVIGLEVGDASLDGWHMWGGDATHNALRGPDPLPAEPPPPSQGTLRAAGRDGRPFPLARTSFSADIVGGIARVTVEQAFTNPHPRAVDAEYLFPLPPDAAVDQMDLRVGARVIRGVIQRRAEARRTFEGARARGRTAALLEQERPGLFRQSVANVRPGEDVRVTLRFAGPVAWRDGRYELVLPTATGAVGSHLERPPGDVTITARVELGAPVEAVESPSHAVAVTREGEAARVTLAGGRALPDRDFVLRVKPRARVVEPSLVARRDGDEGYFALTLHPELTAPDEAVTPRELVFVLDTSSSMRGGPMAHAKALVRRALTRLRPGDTFRLVRFSDEAAELSAAPLAATPEGVARALAWLEGLRAVGSTEMRAGLRAALAGSTPRLRVVVLVTDGYVGDEREVLAELRARLGAARVFAFGVGSAVNRYLLEQAAEEGRGALEVVTPAEDPAAAADRFATRIDRPCLTDVRVDWGGADVRDVYPRAIPDVFADHPVRVTGRYARGGTVTVRVTGRVRGAPWSRAMQVRLPEAAADHEALPALWARARIHDASRVMLLGEVPALREEVTALGLRFGLVTDYTSFVAVDEGAEVVAARVAVPGTSPSMGSGALGAVGYGMGYGMGSGGDFGAMTQGLQLGLRNREGAPPAVRASAPEVAGGIGAEAVRRVVLRNLGQVRAAFERRLRVNPTLRGRVALRIRIDADGAVDAVTVERDTVGDAALARELTQLVARWSFPASEGALEVVYPFVFEGGG